MSTRGAALLAVVSSALGTGIGSGCVTTHVVARPASPESIAAINVAARDNPPLEIDYRIGPQAVDLSLRDAKGLSGADGDTVDVVDLGDQRRSIPAASVRSLRVVNHPRGALQGLIAVVLIGGALGVLLGAGDDTSIVFSRNELMLYGGIGLGALGALAGTIAGGIVGQHEVFVFDDAR